MQNKTENESIKFHDETNDKHINRNIIKREYYSDVFINDKITSDTYKSYYALEITEYNEP